MPQPDPTSLAEKLQALMKPEYYSLHMQAASRFEKYPAKQHARRVRDHLDVVEGLIYLPGARARNNEDSDMPAPFRQRRYFYYLSGCNEPDCHLTYDIQHDILALFIPRIDPARVIYNGRGLTPAEAMDKYDIDEVHYVDELQRGLLEWQMRYSGSLYVLHQEQIPKLPLKCQKINVSSLQPAMNLSRLIKDEHEINLIRKANDISSEAHRQVLAKIQNFKNEAQVEGLFLDVCVSRQAKHQAYRPIAASGPNAGTLHYDANNEDFENRQLICLDAGCEFELYASDITRTFPLRGHWPSKESENIYKLVQRMQESCIKRLGPGVRYLDLHILAHHIAIDGLLKLGILHNGTSEEIYKAGTSKAFFPHGLGHHVGLEVHDVGQKELMSFYEKHAKFEKAPSLYPEDFHLPVYDSEMCRAPTNPESPHLEEGMVVTVEPGIYFSTYALTKFYLPSPVHSKYINNEVVQRYLPVGGVRIEDDILITSKGYENLTIAPKGDDMLTIIRTQNPKLPSVRHSNRDLLRKDPKVVTDRPLFPAPGIPEDMTRLSIRPLSKAATMPLPDRKSLDFGSLNGPPLFSGINPGVERVVSYQPQYKEASPTRSVPSTKEGSSNTKHELSHCNRPIQLAPIDVVNGDTGAQKNLPKISLPVINEKLPEMRQISDVNSFCARQTQLPERSNRTTSNPHNLSASTSPRRSNMLNEQQTQRNPYPTSGTPNYSVECPLPRASSNQNLRTSRQPQPEPIVIRHNVRHNAQDNVLTSPPPFSSPPTTAASILRLNNPPPTISNPYMLQLNKNASAPKQAQPQAPRRHQSLQSLRSGNPYRNDTTPSSRLSPSASSMPDQLPTRVRQTITEIENLRRICLSRQAMFQRQQEHTIAMQDRKIEELMRAMEDHLRLQDGGDIRNIERHQS